MRSDGAGCGRGGRHPAIRNSDAVAAGGGTLLDGDADDLAGEFVGGHPRELRSILQERLKIGRLRVASFGGGGQHTQGYFHGVESLLHYVLVKYRTELAYGIGNSPEARRN